MLQATDLFDFPESLPFSSFFSGELAPWEWVPRIRQALASLTFSPYSATVPAGFQIKGK